MKLSIPIPKTDYKLTVFDAYMNLLLLLPLTTLFQNFIDFINVAVFIVVFIFQAIIALQKTSKKSIVFLAVAFIGYIITLFQNTNLHFNNYLVYYINWLIFATVISLNVDRMIKWLENNEYYVKFVMFVWTFLVGISTVMPFAYYSKEGAGHYFRSYTKSVFRLAPTALFIQMLALISIIVYKHRKDILYMLLPLYCGFMGSSRTYFVIIVAVFVLGLYFFSTTKTKFWLMAGPTGAVGVLVYSFSSMSEKVRYTLDDSQYGDLMYRLSNSRSVIWENIWSAYKTLPFPRQFFGAGFLYTTRVAYGRYAHNDFLEILATHGILGLILYFICFYALFKAFFKGKKVPVAIYAICIFVWAFNAMFNMFYWYTCAAFSFPFMLVAISYFYSQQERKFPKRRKRIVELAREQTQTQQLNK